MESAKKRSTHSFISRLRGRSSARSRRRKGSAVVEFAVVSPVLFMLIFGFIEFGRVTMAEHVLEEAARAGCRRAVIDNATSGDANLAVGRILASAGIANYEVSVEPDPELTEMWDTVTVTVTTSYKDVSWLPAPRFTKSIELAGACSLPSENIAESATTP